MILFWGVNESISEMAVHLKHILYICHVLVGAKIRREGRGWKAHGFMQ